MSEWRRSSEEKGQDVTDDLEQNEREGNWERERESRDNSITRDFEQLVIASEFPSEPFSPFRNFRGSRG